MKSDLKEQQSHLWDWMFQLRATGRKGTSHARICKGASQKKHEPKTMSVSDGVDTWEGHRGRCWSWLIANSFSSMEI